MKKFLSVLTIGFILLNAAACNNEGESVEGPEEINVGVAIYQYDDNFMTLYRGEIERYFDELSNEEVEYKVTVTDGKNDQAEQAAQIDNFITQGMDVMIINLVQTTSASTIIDKCEESGIPCIFINREPSESDMTSVGAEYAGKMTYVGADARQSGRYQGEIIANLDDKGDLNGDGKLNYVMVVGDPENVDAKYRTQYSIEQYIETSGLEVNKLVEERGDWKQERGNEIVANALAQYGEEIEVVFCNNDGMALGAKQAIDAAGRIVGEDIYLVGVDALDEVVDLVEKGEMTGTVLNDHIGQSNKAVDMAIDALNGEKLDTYYWIDYVKVTK